MLLAVDIGNTNVVLGLYEGSALRHTFRVSTARERTADEHTVLLLELLRMRNVERRQVDAAIIASVVPPVTDLLCEAIRTAFAREPLVVGGPGLKTGIAVLYESPRDVGADRIVNAVAAYERVRAGVLIVDFGTATTFDCVSPKAEYLGGIIVPGVQASLDGLLARAAKLTRIEIAEPPRVVGRTTTHSLQSGVIHGSAAMVDGLVARIRDELDFPCRVLATGGLAHVIARHTRSLELVDEYLTLDGLRILHERNS